MLETRIVKGIEAAAPDEGRVAAQFRRLLAEGARLKPAGTARKDPEGLLSRGYTPKHVLELFDWTFFLTNVREDENFRFFVAYAVHQLADRGPRVDVLPRLFYKDSSLIWRSATHYIRSDDENWIGKGDLKLSIVDGEELLHSAEETTNLPFEIQGALDEVSRRGSGVKRDVRAAGLVLRNAPDDRYEPYQDFSGPRERARSDPSNHINGERPVAWFERPNDPASLLFSPGFEPDLVGGEIEVFRSQSRMYGGSVAKHRILSTNRQIQYVFISSPTLVWIVPPQTLTTELNSYGVRTIDVNADEDVFVPGYEYHYVDEDEDPPTLYSQIPRGYAGAQSEVDPSRADASPWIEKLPVIQDFRRLRGI